MMLVCLLLECVVLKRRLTKILVFDVIMSQHKFACRRLLPDQMGTRPKDVSRSMSTNDVPKNFDSCQIAEWHITLQIFGGPRCQFVNDLSRKDTPQMRVVAMLQGGHMSARKKSLDTLNGEAWLRRGTLFFWLQLSRASVRLAGVQETVMSFE